MAAMMMTGELESKSNGDRMEPEETESFTIGELAKAAGVTPRTVRFYQSEGLLPAAGMRGRYTVYNTEHLDRLKLIQQLKRAYLPLSTIRAQVEKLTPDQIHLLAAQNVHFLPKDATEASKYVTDLLESRTSIAGDSEKPKRALWISNRGQSSVTAPPAGEHWTRYVVMEGVELNVRSGALKGELSEEKLKALVKLLSE
jgi:DNA-binding transcriptional MerR regulator